MISKMEAEQKDAYTNLFRLMKKRRIAQIWNEPTVIDKMDN